MVINVGHNNGPQHSASRKATDTARVRVVTRQSATVKTLGKSCGLRVGDIVHYSTSAHEAGSEGKGKKSLEVQGSRWPLKVAIWSPSNLGRKSRDMLIIADDRRLTAAEQRDKAR